MRPFNQREKQIIRNIAQLKLHQMTTVDRFLNDTFFTSVKERALIVRHDQKEVLFFTKPEVWKDVEKVRYELMELFEIIGLLKYLKQQRYIDIFTTPSPMQPVQGMFEEFSKTEKKEKGKYFLNDAGDYLETDNNNYSIVEKPLPIFNSKGETKMLGGRLSDYYETIYENCFGLLFPSESLYDFVNNDFKTAEDRKHEQNIKIGRLGLLTAILIGVLSIAIQVFDDSGKSIKSIEKSNSKYFQTLIDIEKENNSGLKKLLETKPVERDTTKN